MDEEILPISGVEHYAYCQRQAALIHMEGVWAENAHTAQGSVAHAAVDRETRLVQRQGYDCWLSLPVHSERLKVRGVCDSVELTPAPVPVEHKPVRSRQHRSPAAQHNWRSRRCAWRKCSARVFPLECCTPGRSADARQWPLIQTCASPLWPLSPVSERC